MDNVTSAPERQQDKTPTDGPQPDKTQTDVSEWQRISPIAMLYFLLKFIKGFAGNFVYIAPALIVGYKTVMENLAVAVPVLFILLSLSLIGTFLSYYFFQFRLINQHIHIRSGVFAKKYVNLPFERVQNIQLLEPVYYRPFGYTCLQLDTAGSNKQEANIVALPMAQALAIKTEILRHIKQQAKKNSLENEQAIALANGSTNADDLTPANNTLACAETDQLLIKRGLTELVIHGLSNNRIWIFLGGLAPFYEKIKDLVVSTAQRLGFDIELFIDTYVVTPPQIALFAIAAFLLVGCIIMLLSVLGSIISYYGFTLTKHNDRYVRKSGLLSKHEVTMKHSRLQMIVSTQSWLDHLFKRTNLKFEQNSSQTSDNGMPTDEHKIVVPSVTYKERSVLVKDAFPKNLLDQTHFKRISKHFIMRYVFYWFLPLYLIACLVLMALAKTSWLVVPTAIYAALSVLVYYRWRRWGYSRDDNFIYIRKGFIGTNHYCFPITKVQQTRWHQSVFQKKRGLCRIQFVLASGSVSVPYIPQSDGLEYCDYALHIVETKREPWM